MKRETKEFLVVWLYAALTPIMLFGYYYGLIDYSPALFWVMSIAGIFLLARLVIIGGGIITISKVVRMNKESVTRLVTLAGLFAVSVFIFHYVFFSDDCLYSPHSYKYTNSTDGGLRIGDNCYVEDNSWIKVSRECDFGLFCRDVEPHEELVREVVCFNIISGERC